VGFCEVDHAWPYPEITDRELKSLATGVPPDLTNMFWIDQSL
jgi:hypothetical protein